MKPSFKLLSMMLSILMIYSLQITAAAGRSDETAAVQKAAAQAQRGNKPAAKKALATVHPSTVEKYLKTVTKKLPKKIEDFFNEWFHEKKYGANFEEEQSRLKRRFKSKHERFNKNDDDYNDALQRLKANQKDRVAAGDKSDKVAELARAAERIINPDLDTEALAETNRKHAEELKAKNDEIDRLKAAHDAAMKQATDRAEAAAKQATDDAEAQRKALQDQLNAQAQAATKKAAELEAAHKAAMEKQADAHQAQVAADQKKLNTLVADKPSLLDTVTQEFPTGVQAAASIVKTGVHVLTAPKQEDLQRMAMDRAVQLGVQPDEYGKHHDKKKAEEAERTAKAEKERQDAEDRAQTAMRIEKEKQEALDNVKKSEIESLHAQAAFSDKKAEEADDKAKQAGWSRAWWNLSKEAQAHRANAATLRKEADKLENPEKYQQEESEVNSDDD